MAAATASLTTSASAYTVKPGDTLWSISHRTGESVARITAQNHLANPNLITVGRQLVLDSEAPPAPPAAGRPAVYYVVRPGDTLWGISHATATPVATLMSLNGITNPRSLRPGQRLLIDPPVAAPAPPAPAGSKAVSGDAAKALLRAASGEFGVDPALLLALSLWESGWNQASRSSTGAVGLMQIEPYTAAWAGPALLGRRVDITDARSNARLGAALIHRYLVEFGDPHLALAAYYQGELGTRRYGVFPSSVHYVNGILALRDRLART